MKTNRLLYGVVALSLMVAAWGCSDDDNANDSGLGPQAGSSGVILVEVLNERDDPVVGALVMTNPPTIRDTTGSLGTVMLEEIPVGTYQVIASKPGYGAGSKACRVSADDPANLEIDLERGSFIGPNVQIDYSYYPRRYSYIDTTDISASIIDDVDPPESLTVVWSSDVDGILLEPTLPASGLTSLVTDELSLGRHVISLEATDKDSLLGLDTAIVDIVSFQPNVYITRPYYGQYGPGDTLEFKALVRDHESDHDQIEVTWTSDLDGELHSGPPDAYDTSRFTSAVATKGIHTIEVKATDHDGNTAYDTTSVRAVLPTVSHLTSVESEYGAVTLRWTRNPDQDFDRYVIYRDWGYYFYPDSIGVVTDQDSLAFVDDNVTLGRTYIYSIGVVDTAGNSSRSPVDSVIAGTYLDYTGEITRMMADTLRDLIYLLDRSSSKLVAIDPATEQVQESIVVGSYPTDMDVDATGDTMYIANFGGTEIAVVDLESMTKARSIFVQQNPYRLECGPQGRLVYCEEDQWCDIILIDTEDGSELDVAGWGAYQPDLEMSLDRMSVYAGESGTSGGSIYRWDITGDSLHMIDETPGYGYYYPHRYLQMDRNGQYLYYYNHKINAGILSSVIGTLPKRIYVLNNAGTVILTSAGLVDTETLQTIQSMNTPGAVAAFTPDDTKLYMYDDDSERIYIILVGDD
ncbi:hypothetical protein GF356_00105 [candidate division GN15 bacterium]|nr:hypothetical protein [candidate division GN15 bacterium]